MLREGYAGAHAADLTELMRRGKLVSLIMQSPRGEIPVLVLVACCLLIETVDGDDVVVVVVNVDGWAEQSAPVERGGHDGVVRIGSDGHGPKCRQPLPV